MVPSLGYFLNYSSSKITILQSLTLVEITRVYGDVKSKSRDISFDVYDYRGTRLEGLLYICSDGGILLSNLLDVVLKRVRT